jgi:hypothetical protein
VLPLMTGGGGAGPGGSCLHRLLTNAHSAGGLLDFSDFFSLVNSCVL